MAIKQNDKEFNISDALYVSPKQITDDITSWLARMQGAKRYSKYPDFLFIKKSGDFNYLAAKKLYDILRDQDFKKSVLQASEISLSKNDGKKENAYILWTIDIGEKTPWFNWVPSKNIVFLETVGNKIIGVQHIAYIFKIKDTSYQIRQYRSKDEIKTTLWTIGKQEITEITDYDNLTDDVKEEIKKYTLGSVAWTGNLPSFVFEKNTADGLSDSAFISTEIEELIVLKQKKRDEILFNSTKVLNVGRTTQDRNKTDQNASAAAEKQAKMMAAASVIALPSQALGTTAQVSVAQARPNLDVFSAEERKLKGDILKKTGGITDLDSKGTVQVTDTQTYAAQGSEFIMANEKVSSRQDALKKFAEIIVDYFQNLKKDAIFEDIADVLVIINQEESISELDQLNGLILAKQNKFISESVAISRYLGISILDSLVISKINFEGLDKGGK